MSYILDALKRADTERERGAAPGLHTRHQLPADNTGTSSERRPVWLAIAAGLILVMLALGFWSWRAPDAPPMAALTSQASLAPNTPTLAAPAAPAAPVAPSTPPAAITPIAPVRIGVAEAPVAKARPTEKTSPDAVTAAPAKSTQLAVSATSTEAVAGKTVIPPASTLASAASSAASAASAASAPTAVRPAPSALLSELPPELRNQIPKISITGSVYSVSPAQRLLVVNNLVLAQGGQVSADLKLEEIQPRSSVFNFRGTRFRVMH